MFYLLNKLNKSEITNKTKNIQKIIIAMSLAPSAIPPNPKIAAIMAITRKIITHRNIILVFKISVTKVEKYVSEFLLFI